MARRREHFENHLDLNGIYANNTLGTAGQVLKSDGENVYWGEASASVGDATTLDGYDSAEFARLAATNTFTLTQTINLNAATAPSPGTTGVILQLSGADGISTRLWLDSYGAGTNYTARRANGTNATKTALLSADVIMNNSAFGHDGTAYSTSSRGAYQIAASQNWAVGAHGTRLLLATTPDNSTTQATRWIVENDGSFIYSGATATGNGTVNANDYFDNGVNINTIYLASSSYTAADVLAKLLTVDGVTSGLDAQFWAGNAFASYIDQALLTTSTPRFSSVYIGSDIDLRIYESSTNVMTLRAGGTGTETYLTIGASGFLQVNGSNIWHAGNMIIGTHVQAYDADLSSWALITRASGFDTFVATPSGANLAALLTSALPVSKGGTNATAAGITAFNNITGYTAAGATGTTSTNIVFSTSPTLVTPVLGAATATSINGLTLTSSTGTLTITNLKTLSVSNTLTLTATDGSTLAIGAGGTLASAAYVATGTSGATIPLLNGNNTYSGISAFTGQVTMSRAAVPLQVTNTLDNANVQGFIIEGDRATPAANDILYQSWNLSNSAGTQLEFGRMDIVASTVTAASEASYFRWSVRSAGTLTTVARLAATAFTPHTSDGLALGNTSLMWADLFLASGGTINWNNSDVTITHGTNTLAFAGASSGYTFDALTTFSATGAAGGTGLVDIGLFLNISGFAPNIVFTDLSASVNPWFIHYNQGEFVIGETVTSVATERLKMTTTALTWLGNTVWHAGNMIIGTHVQAYDADLSSWALITRAAGFDTFVATPSGANLATLLTSALPVSKGGTNATAAGITAFNNITGYTAAGATGTTSTNLVFSTSPTLVTPVLGVATATSINGLTLTSSTGTLTITNAKTLSVSNTLTLTATDGSTLAIGAGGTLASAAYVATGTSGATIPLLNGTNTWGAVQTFSVAPSFGALPTGAGVASAATASTLAARDSSGNLASNIFLPGYATTVTAAGTTVLTAASAQIQYFTGTTTQTVTLPVTSTLSLGLTYTVVNNSSGAVTVQSSGLNSVLVVAAGSMADFTCILTSGTSAASWNSFSYSAGNANITSWAAITRASGFDAFVATPSGANLATLLTSALPVSKGGTNATAAGITAFNNITGYTAAGATGTTSTNLVFSTSPTLVTPVLGAATATSINGLTLTSSTGTLTITNLKTLSVSNTLTLTATDGSTLAIGAGGTLGTAAYTASSAYQPIDSDLTSWALITRASGFDTFVATPSGANLATLLTTALPVSKGGTNATAAGITAFNNITGYTAAGATGTTSTNLVFSTSPTLVTPVLGAATATSINGLTLTSSTGTLTITNAKTLSVSNTLTLTATDGSTLAIGAGGTLASAAYVATGTSGATIPLLNGTNTWANGQTFSSTVVFSNVPTINAANPIFQFYESDQALDTKLWEHNVNGGVFTFRLVNDAYSAASTIFSVTRSTHLSSVFNFGSTVTLQLNGVAIPTISSTDTFTNKTLTTPTINGAALSGTFSGTPTYSGNPLYSSATSFSPQVVIRNTNTDAFGGYLILDKIASDNLLSVSDALGVLMFRGVDTVGGVRNAAYLQATVRSQSATFVGASLDFYTSVASLLDTIEGGFYGGLALGSPTGSYKGVGTLNATNIYVNNVLVPTISSTSTLTNKTLTTPTIDGASLSGTFGGSPTFSGQPTFNLDIILGRTTGTNVIYYGAGSTFAVALSGTGNAMTLDGSRNMAVTGTFSCSTTASVSSTSANALMTLTSTEAGATAFTFDLYRNSASPAASDGLAAIRFRGQNSTPATVTYSSIQSNIADTTAASEDANLYLQTMMAGTLVNALTLGMSTIEHRFTTPTDSIVSSQGTSGYGSFLARGSGTNSAYMFFSNITNGERGRIWATNASALSMSTNAGVTAHFSIDSSGNLTASGVAIPTISSTDTFTNKTLTSPTINSGTLNGSYGGTPTFTGGTLTLNASNHGIELGSTSATNTPFIDFHTTNSANDYDVRIIASGGTTVGTGTLDIGASALTRNSVAIPTISSTDTFTNKTLTSPTINSGALSGTFSGTHTYSGSTTFSGGLTSSSSTGLLLTYQSAAQGSSISLNKGASGTTLAGPVVIDINANTMRIYENGGSFRGIYFDLTTMGSQSLLATTDTTQTFTNKTLTTPTINGAAVSGTITGTATWSGTQTMSGLTARVTLTTAVSGTLTSAHANISVELNGNVTLNNSVFTAGDKTVFDPGTAARTFTRGAGVTMYVNGTDSATATLAANQIGGAHWRTASVVVLTGAFT